ncbi:cysteine hydrolase family protein [Pontibacillus sp. HN14]
MKTKRTAILFIDLINDFQFQHGSTLLNECHSMLPNILRLKSYANKHNLPIIYINDHYKLWQADLDRIVDKCRNEQNHTFLNQIIPAQSDYFLIKPKHSAFHQTALQALLVELKVDHLIISGIAGNICVLFTANDAYMREYTLHVPSDCIASNDPEDNIYALKMMKNVLKADVSPIRKT